MNGLFGLQTFHFRFLIGYKYEQKKTVWTWESGFVVALQVFVFTIVHNSTLSCVESNQLQQL
jgi:hypothetical protein